MKPIATPALALAALLAACSGGTETGNALVQSWGQLKVVDEVPGTGGSPATAGSTATAASAATFGPTLGDDAIRIANGRCLVVEMAQGNQVEVLLDLPAEEIPFDLSAVLENRGELPPNFLVQAQGHLRPDLAPRCGAQEVMEIDASLGPLFPEEEPGHLPFHLVGLVSKAVVGCPVTIEGVPAPGSLEPVNRIHPLGPKAVELISLAEGEQVAILGFAVPGVGDECGLPVQVIDFKPLPGPPPTPQPIELAGRLVQSPDLPACWRLVPPVPALEDALDFEVEPDFTLDVDFAQPPELLPGLTESAPVPLPLGPLPVGALPLPAASPLPPLFSVEPPRPPVIEPIGPLADALKAEVNANGGLFVVRGFPRFEAAGVCPNALPFEVTDYGPVIPPPQPEFVTAVGLAVRLELEGGCNALLTPRGMIRPVGELAEGFWANPGNLEHLAAVRGRPAPGLVSFCPGLPFFVAEARHVEPPPPPPHIELAGAIERTAEGCLVLPAGGERFVLLFPHAFLIPELPAPPFVFDSVPVRVEGWLVGPERLPAPLACAGIPLVTTGIEPLLPPPPSPLPVEPIEMGAPGVPLVGPGFHVLRSPGDLLEAQTLYPGIVAAGPFDFMQEMLVLAVLPEAAVIDGIATILYEPPLLLFHVLADASPGTDSFALFVMPRVDRPVEFIPLIEPVP